MRTLTLAGLILLGCGGHVQAIGMTCAGDDQCAGDLVCSGTAGGACTSLCDVGQSGQECAPVNGRQYWCGKYVGPTSAGYACSPR